MKKSSHPVKRAVQQVLRSAGYNLYRLSEMEQRMLAQHEQRQGPQSIDVLFGSQIEHLRELRQKYAEVRLPVAQHSLWDSRANAETVRDIGIGGVDLRRFRGHSAYVFDYVESNLEATSLRYFIFSDAVRRKDLSGLLKTLTEDGAFGCVTFEYQGIGRVSRDLLDSVAELSFLHQHLHVLQRDDLRILDIGAGYGRLAHRMLQANPKTKSYSCADAVPESTFLCEFYLRFRGLQDKAEVIPLHELDARLTDRRFDLAVNVHSFSECTYAAIEWWLRRLRQLEVPKLMIVPNHPTRFLSTEVDRSHLDYAPLLKELGYRLSAQEPVFDDPAVQDLLGVRDNRFLFSLW